MRNVVFLNVAQPRFYTILLGVFAGLALLLAAAGLYGVLAYSVSRRISEIGIRVALGAAPGSVLRIVISEALLLVGAGICLGLAGSFALTRLIAAQLFQTKTTDPATFAAVCAVLLAAAGVASYVPARRALRVDPAIALRCE
jgi:putative ABC transport system permease protein